MLAERKKKVKWTLNPRGNSWSQDTNKFGQRMLEKMGWKTGEGLGVNKQGITENIKVAYKNDNKCLGYKDSGAEWVEHQSQFESLLAELSSSHSTIAALDSGKNKISQTETLEQRSRHSRTRVHYQKFTREKDLSKYSEKDLKCILLSKQKSNSADEQNEDNDGSNEYLNQFYGIKTINSGSMNDYFKKLKNSHNYLDTYTSDVQSEEVHVSNDGGEQCDVKVKKQKERKAEVQKSDTADVQFEEVRVSNDGGEQCDGKVKKQKERKAEMQMSDAVLSNIDSDKTSSIKQHKKRKKCKVQHSDSANDDCAYMDYENGTVSIKRLQRYAITDAEGSIINDICNEELYCDEICSEKKPNKWKNCSIQEGECEVMEIGDEIEDKQMKKRSKKKSSELITEDSETLLVPTDVVSCKLENSEVLEHLIDNPDNEIEIRREKKESRNKHPVTSSEETSPVSEERVLHDSKNGIDTLLHLTAELDEVEGKQRKKKFKKKKREFTGDGETSLVPIENISHTLENSEVVGKQLKKKSIKKTHYILCDSGENSVLAAEAAVCRWNTEQHLTVIAVDEIERKQLKRKSKKRKLELLSEGGRTSIVSLQNVSQIKENLENTVENLMDKEEDKLPEDTPGVDISLENDLKAADANRVYHGGSSDDNINSYEQAAEDVIRTKRKKKKNAKINDVDNIYIKKKHRKKKNENEIDEHSEQAEYAVKENERTNTKEELQSAANNIHCSPQSSENTVEKLNKDCLESHTKFNGKYSTDEIKNMKSSLFAQLVDPRLVEFKGSNLHTIAGYGKY